MSIGFNKTRMLWAKKLLKAKFFIVLTDKEAAIAFEGVDPYSFSDSIALAAQKAELEHFQESINKLVGDHDKALRRLAGKNKATK